MKHLSGDLQPGSVQPKQLLKSSTLPAPPPTLGYDLFRQKLLGLADPDRHPGEAEKQAVREDAVRFVTVLAHLFGDDLDRKTLWSRIASALETAHAKVSDDDLDRYADLCLEHVQADAGQAAACDALTALRQAWQTRTPEWRYSFLAYCGTHRFALLSHGRSRWEKVKSKAVEL